MQRRNESRPLDRLEYNSLNDPLTTPSLRCSHDDEAPTVVSLALSSPSYSCTQRYTST